MASKNKNKKKTKTKTVSKVTSVTGAKKINVSRPAEKLSAYTPSTWEGGEYTPTTWDKEYTPSQFTETYTPGVYESQYTDQINAARDKVTNWKYDPLEDASYQALQKVYTNRGNLAAKSSLADAAALNGGYGSSYAVSAAQQARNQYNQELMSLVPDLEANAYNRAATAYDIWMDADNTAYGRFRDTESDRQKQYEYNYQKWYDAEQNAFNAYQQNYNQWADREANNQWAYGQNYQQWADAEANRQFARNDQVDRWNSRWSHFLDAQSQNMQRKQLYASLKKGSSGGGDGGRSGGGRRSSGGGYSGGGSSGSSAFQSALKKAKEQKKTPKKTTTKKYWANR